MGVESALSLAEKGFHVFPCRPRSKKPLIKEWERRATTDPEQIKKWWTQKPDANVAVACGPSNLGVIDIDPGKGGFQSLALLEMEYGELDDSFKVRTPSGGIHLYFTCVEPIPNSQSRLGEGIDTRGKGGYVVSVGSVTADGLYRLEKDDSDEFPVFPADIQHALGTVQNKSANRDDQLSDELDTPSAIARGIEYCKSGAEPAIEGQAGDLQTYKTACRMRDFGLSEVQVLDCMLEHYNERCEPSWEPDDLSEKVRSAYRNAQNAGGVQDAAVTFGEYTGPMPKITKETPTFQLYPASHYELVNIPPREWVLGSRLIAGYVTVTVAPGGTGKSMYSLLEALSIATGEPLCGAIPHKQGKVLVYNTEDPRDEILRRLVGLCLYHNIDLSALDNVYIESGIEQPLVVAKEVRGQGVTFTKRAKEFEAICKSEQFVAITLDPFVRTHRINENDNSQMDTVVNYFSRIAMRTGAAVSLIHHTRKAASGDTVAGNVDTARGASALVDAARIASTLTSMSLKEAEAMGIAQDQRFRHLRLDNAKGNMAPPATAATWFTMSSQNLANGDSVGVLEVANPEDWVTAAATRRLMSQEELAQILIPFVEPSDKNAMDCAKLLTEQHSHLLDPDTKVASLAKRLMRMFSESFIYEGVTLRSYEKKTSSAKRWLTITEEEIEL